MRPAFRFILLLVLITLTAGAYCTVESNAIERIPKKDSSYINKLLDLSDNLTASNNDKAREFANEALKLSTKYNNSDGIARSLNIIGNIYLNQSDYYEAKRHYEQSLDYFKKNNNKDGIAETLRGLGINSEAHGRYTDAINSFEQAYILYHQLDDKISIASTCNNLGVVYYLAGNTQSALKRYTEAQRILEQFGDTSNLKQTLVNKGDLFLEIDNLDSARYYIETCHKIILSQPTDPGLANSFLRFGNLLKAECNYNKAIQYFDSSLVYSSRLDSKELKCKALISKVIVFQIQRKFQSSISSLKECLEIAEQENLSEEIKQCHFILAEVNSELKNYKAAFNNFKLYEQLNSEQIQANTIEQESEAFIKKQEQENKILRLERDQQARKVQMTVFLCVFVLALISFAFIIIVKNVKQKGAIERILSVQQKAYFDTALEAQERERKRIASDLHDSVGQMLSLVKLNISELNDSICAKSLEFQELLDRSQKIIDDACTEVRSISHNLMPGSLINLGLISASRDLIRTLNKSTNINVSLNTELNGKRFEEKLEIAFFRILQELINNSIRHSNATKIQVHFELSNNLLKLTVKDNGDGFDFDTINSSPGIGWKNINTRLSLINGKVNVSAEKEWGSIVSVLAHTN
jgi:two-component system, NarL family, sensor kinase